MDEDSENKLKETELPNIKYFHSRLNNTKCTTDYYEYGQKIYDYFKCKEITNDLYVKTDVLLANVCTSYRQKMHKNYGLDPLYCKSAPGFSNRAMLKMTNVES